MTRHDLIKKIVLVTLALGIILPLVGCHMVVDSFGDPTIIGRWKREPVTMPILYNLDIIEDAADAQLTVTPVRPEDLVPDKSEYVIGTGDVTQINIFELIVPGQDAIQTRRVDETGVIRLQLVGPIQAEGLSPSQLEKSITAALGDKGILRDPTVSVIMLQTQQNTFSVLGQPSAGGTNVGTYAIPMPDFRLLDALALARGISGRTKKLTIIRQVALDPAVAGETQLPPAAQEDEQPAAAVQDPTQLIDEMMETLDEIEFDSDSPEAEAAPSAIEATLDRPDDSGQWVNVDGKWMRVEQSETATTAEMGDEFAGLVTQRIIEVPYQILSRGDMRYNLVVRPGDMIKVPERVAGFVYIMGQTARPGSYTIPGEAELTLTQLIASSGGLGGLAIPERTEIRRRIGEDQEAILRVNLRAIFQGTAPNIFLKPNDEINVGTNFWATPMAVLRNGLRMTYGFGFVLDRNFGFDVFPP